VTVSGDSTVISVEFETVIIVRVRACWARFITVRLIVPTSPANIVVEQLQVVEVFVHDPLVTDALTRERGSPTFTRVEPDITVNARTTETKRVPARGRSKTFLNRKGLAFCAT